MKVLLFGRDAHLGAALAHEFDAHATVTSLARQDVDVTDDRAVRDRIAAEAPAVVLNCAAYNAVDAAEDDPVAALNVNALAVRAMARASAQAGAILVHYSTDFVFDGRTDRPYRESDPPNPQSVYAVSKWLGEWFAADAPRHYVLRVESLFGAAPGGPRRGSAETIIARIRNGEEVSVFEDRTVSPGHVLDIAAATRQIIERRVRYGTYHCVNSGQCTWLEFAEAAAGLLGRPARLNRIRFDDARLRALRPKYSALANAALQSCGIVMPSWQDALGRELHESRTS